MEKRVLIVDDDPSALRLMEQFLVESGYEVLQASSGEEAIQVVLEHAPPLIISDYSMGVMNGADLCRALRGHEGVRFAYVLIVTAYADTDRLVEVVEAGADDFIAKPINRQEFLARLRAGERIARLEEDLARRTREIHRLNALSAVANQKLEEANAKLRRMATTDELTGLLNRREAMSRMSELWSYSVRYGPSLSFIMLDIDQFKRVNDTHGHAVGDQVQREIAVILKETVRKSDAVARLGGDEFLVICPHVGLDGAAVCAEHIRRAIAGHAFGDSATALEVTVSLGVAHRDHSVPTPEFLLKLADEALYASKAKGRNCVSLAGQQAAASLDVASVGPAVVSLS